MLEELSKNNSGWRKMAYHICKDSSLADDLVNDMYIKLHDTGKSYEQINEWFIYVTIKNLYINIIKERQKTISLEYCYNIEDLYNNDDLILIRRKEVNAALAELDVWDREILLHTSETSLRKLSAITGISVMTLFHSKNIALEKLKLKL